MSLLRVTIRAKSWKIHRMFLINWFQTNQKYKLSTRNLNKFSYRSSSDMSLMKVIIRPKLQKLQIQKTTDAFFISIVNYFLSVKIKML